MSERDALAAAVGAALDRYPLINLERGEYEAVAATAADACRAAGWVPAKQHAKVERRARRWESECITATQELLAVRRDLTSAQRQSEGHLSGLATFRSMWREAKVERDALAATVERVQAQADEWCGATCVTDGAPCSWHRVAVECAAELRAALAPSEPASEEASG